MEEDKRVLLIDGSKTYTGMFEAINHAVQEMREEMTQQLVEGDVMETIRMHPALFDQLAEAAPVRQMVTPDGTTFFYNPDTTKHLRQQEALRIVERAKVEGVFVPNKEPNRAQRRAAKRRKQ